MAVESAWGAVSGLVPRRLRPVPNRSVDGGPSPTTGLATRRGGEARDGSRVHCCSLGEGGAQLCPCGIATATPQHFHRGLPATPLKATQKFPPTPANGADGAHRTRSIHQIQQTGEPLRDFDAGSSRTPLHHARRTRTIWQYWQRPGFVRAAPTRSGTSRTRLPPAPPPPLRRGQRRRSLTSTQSTSASRRTGGVTHVRAEPD